MILRLLGVLITIIAFASLVPTTEACSKHWWHNHDRIKGSGDLVTETRTVDSFTEIRAHGSFDVYVTLGSVQEVKLTFDDNIIKYVETEVRHGVLDIDTDEDYSTRSRVRVDIVVPVLDEFSMSGSGDTEISRLKADEFTYDVSGSGDLSIDGEVGELRLGISGSGDVDARDLKARDVHVRISGSGDVSIYAIETIEGRISGSGDITYYGPARNVGARVSGSGTIRKKR